MNELVAGLTVSEIFGPTVSGEGRSLGQRCGFLRLMACNLHCSWCDTPYTWDARRYNLAEQGRWMNWTVITDALTAMDVPLVVISGGEPLLHQNRPAWEPVLRALSGAGVRVEIETNGTIVPNRASQEYVAHFTVSPKLAHAGDPEEARIVPEAIGVLKLQGADFKFVCATADHVAEVQRWVKILDLPPERIWVMPEGTDHQTLCDHLAVITDPATAAGFNVTTRLHIDVWGNERGH